VSLNQPDLGELFHLHSSYSNARNDELEPVQDIFPGHFRTYPGSVRHQLPHSEIESDIPLRVALTRRRSIREFRPCPMPIEQVACLLRMSYGVIQWSQKDGLRLAQRPIPSGGALYPLEVYAASQGVVGLPDGLYHYDARGHALEQRQSGSVHKELARATWVPDSILGATLVILITAVSARTTRKYGLRGYRFLWLEAGHLAQNLYLIAQALGLGALEVGAFSDDDVDRLARLPEGERTLSILCIGSLRPKPPSS
jgi:SagB-type dehydrogenase family enzyme